MSLFPCFLNRMSSEVLQDRRYFDFSNLEVEKLHKVEDRKMMDVKHGRLDRLALGKRMDGPVVPIAGMNPSCQPPIFGAHKMSFVDLLQKSF